MEYNSANPFDLTPIEFRVFNEILIKKEVSVGGLIKILGIHKGTAYNTLRRLEEKGIVSFRNIGGVKKYSVPEMALKKKLDETSVKMEDISSQIRILIDIAKNNDVAKESPKVELLLGHEGFKSFFNDLYRWADKTKNEYLFMGKGNEMIKEFGEEYYRRTQQIKRRMKLRCRVILNKVSKQLPIQKHVVGNVRYVDMEYTSPVSMWIYGDMVVIVAFGSKPLTTIMIRSKDIAESYKNYFELLWKKLR